MKKKTAEDVRDCVVSVVLFACVVVFLPVVFVRGVLAFLLWIIEAGLEFSGDRIAEAMDDFSHWMTKGHNDTDT